MISVNDICQIHRTLGFTILTKRDICNRNRNEIFAEFPKDKLFSPKRVTLEEARIAMKKCREK